MSELPKITWDDEAPEIKWDAPASRSTAEIVGTNVGAGTRGLLNIPKDVLSGALRALDFFGRVAREDVPLTGVGDYEIPAPDAPQTGKLPPPGALGRAADWAERNFDVGNTFDALGIAHRPPPENELSAGERMLATASRTLGGAVPVGTAYSALSKGAAPLLGQLKQAGLMSAGAAVGREVGGPMGEIAGGLAFPLAGPAAVELVRRAGRGADPAGLTRAIDEAARAGTTLSVGQGTGSRFWSGMESTTGRFGGVGVMHRKGEAQASQLGQKAEETAATLAPKMDDAEAGRRILSRLTGPGGYVERFKSMADRMFNRVNHTGPVRLSETTAYLDEATAPLAGAEATSAALVNPALKALYSNLVKDVARAQGIKLTPQQIDAFIGSPTTRPAGVLGDADLPFEVVKGLRSAIGRKIGSPGLIDDIPKGELKRLYGALSADIEVALASNPRALAAWQRANNFYRQGVAKIDSTIEPLANAGAPERIMSLLDQQAKRGGTELRRVMTSLKPDERNIVAARFIRDLGMATPANQLAPGATEIFSPAIFIQRYGKLKESGADKVLFGGTNRADLGRALDALYETSKRIKKGSQILANPSGTAAAHYNLYQWFGVGGTGGMASLLTGNLAPAAATLGSMTVANGMARLLTNPKAVRWLARSTSTPPGLWAQQGEKLATDPDLRAAVGAILGGELPPQNRTPQ